MTKLNSIFLVAFLSCLFITIVDCKNNNSPKIISAVSPSEYHFKQDSLLINGISIFNLNQKQLIEKLGLEATDNDYDYKFNNNELTIANDTIVYFSIDNNTTRLSNPSLFIGMDEKDVKRNFPIAYSRLTKDSIYDIEMMSFEIYDENDNRLRVYLKDGKVYSISYFIFENF